MAKAATLARKLAKESGEWTATVGSGYHDGSQAWKDHTSGTWASFARDGVVISLNLSTPSSEWARGWAFEGLTVEGHTCFDGRSFTRRGVDTSSCRLTSNAKEIHDHSYGTLAELLAGEYARCTAARERAVTAIPVPGLPFSVQPAWFTTSAVKLREGRMVNLTPAGFGTGYHLSLRGGAWRKRVSAELETRLGVGPVFVESFDHD